MFQTERAPVYVQNEHAVSGRLLLASLPVILFIAFLCGSLAFLFGQDPSKTNNERIAKLPVAGDRLVVFGSYQPLFGKPLVVYAAKATNPLAAVNTPDEGNWVRIPALKSNTPVSEAASMADADVLKVLAAGVAMYPNGIHPGENGNVFIAGHSTGEPWKGPYRFAFMNINKLKTGDTILVDYNKTRYTYSVTETQVINPQDTHFIESAGETPTLSLMACWPLWTAKHRMIIKAKLVAINPLMVVK